jgi:hypothetical protein
MSAFLRTGRSVRAGAALAVDYAFLFQLLLAGIAVTQMVAAATDDARVICSAGGNDTAEGAHQACAICTFVYPALLRPTAAASVFSKES